MLVKEPSKINGINLFLSNVALDHVVHASTALDTCGYLHNFGGDRVVHSIANGSIKDNWWKEEYGK